MQDYFSFSTVSSTNDCAKILLEGRTEVIITANYQTNGRGRNNKRWLGDYGGNIYISYGKVHIDIENDVSQKMLLFQCIGCLAIKRVLEKISPMQKFTLKYPNDIYALQSGEWRKISGVLVENEFVGSKLKSTILGIGVNGLQIEFNPEIVATSLVLLDITIEINTLKKYIVEEMKSLLNKDSEDVINEWKEVLKIKKKKLRIIGEEGTWKVRDFNEFGMLIVENEVKERVVGNGDSIKYDLS